ncbi:MAG: GNAT family N-acetyltransferase [Deltaproteobacteria bacterium RBG_19FT_COMBO_43_11]|nr:MAG: GNAT family N-acetyltransferase [Deltaproteobacteria bacterium RBG_19FT_COMBO_43_11]
MLIIKPERKDDYAQITKINDASFEQPNEGRLVANLRKNKIFIPQLSLVAQMDDDIVGHILFFPIKVVDEGREHKSIALAPVSVHPSYQKKGIGSALIKEGLARCKKEGFQSVIFLGHPDYYPRFGFKPASLWKISAPFDVPDEAFMAIELKENALKNVRGVIQYPEEFNVA